MAKRSVEHSRPSRAERERRRLEVLYDVTRRLAAVEDTAHILDLIVNAATTLLEVEAAGLRLRDGNDLVLKARTESAAAVMARARLTGGESLIGAVVTTGQPVAVEDLVEDTRYDLRHKRAAVELGFHGFLGVPLRTHQRIIGVLNVYTKQRRRFREDEIALLASFADHASLAIEKDRMLREARELAARSRALARVNQAVSSSLDIGEVLHAIAAAAAELMGARTVAFWVADETRREVHLRATSEDQMAADYPVHSLRFNEGIAGWVAAHRRPLDVPDVFRDPRVLAADWCRTHGLVSAHATPIMFQTVLLGVLVLFGGTPLRVSEDDPELLQAFVAQAGVAIRNARLYDEARIAEDRLLRLPLQRRIDLILDIAVVVGGLILVVVTRWISAGSAAGQNRGSKDDICYFSLHCGPLAY